VVVVLASIGNVIYLQADHHYIQAKAGSLSIDERIQELETAISLNPSNDMYRAELGLQYQGWFGYAVDQAAQKRQAGEDATLFDQQASYAFENAEKAFLDVIDFVPSEYDNYVFLSNLYNTGGAYLDQAYFQKAAEIGLRGIEVEEYGPAIRLQYSWSLQGLGRYEEAAEQLEIATAMDPAYLDAYRMLGDVYVGLGRDEDAIEVYEHTLEAQPGNEAVQAAIVAAQERLAAAGTSP